MKERGRRELGLILSWFATAVVAGLLGARFLTSGPVDSGFRESEPGVEPGEGRDPRPPALAVGPKRGDESTPLSASGDSQPLPEPYVESGASPALGSAAVLVTALDAEGKPLADGWVYALEAGAPGSDDADDLCHAGVEGSDPVLLRLPGPGLYDIGYAGNSGSALTLDLHVAAGAPAPVTVKMDGGARVRVEVDPPWPPPAAGSISGSVELVPVVEERRLRFCPGRGEGAAVRWARIPLAGGQSSAEGPPLPAGSEWRVRSSLQELRPRGYGRTEEERRKPEWLDSWRFEWIPDREVVRPGETIRLRTKAWAALAVRLDASRVGNGPAGPPMDAVEVAIEFLQGEKVLQTQWRKLARAFPEPFQSVSWFRSEGGPCRLRWSGAGVLAGESEILDLQPGEWRTYDLTFQPDPGGQRALPPVARGEIEPEVLPEPLEVRVAGVPPAETDGIRAAGWVAGKDGHGEGLETDDLDWVPDGSAAGLGLHPEWRSASQIVFVRGTDLASDPVAAPAAGPLEVRLKPAGLLCVVPDRIVEPGLGRLRVRLPDGRLLPEGVEGAEPEPAVQVGSLLGPLPVGTYTFQVKLGGVRLPDATAAVRKGTIEVLRIRVTRE